MEKFYTKPPCSMLLAPSTNIKAMKKNLLLFAFSICLFNYFQAQEYAQFEMTGTNEGTGTFTNAALPNFSWEAIGAIYEIEVLNDEVFDDGNAFENTFGQANYADNLRTQNYPNGEGTIGDTVLSISLLTLTFDETTPAFGWGFCVTDIDVENCLIHAVDDNDEPVAAGIIDQWLVELFDCDHGADGINIPKWDPDNAALLGSDTPETYIVYDNVIIGDMPSSEAAAAFFMPNIPLKQLSIRFENLQDVYFTSYHLYIASFDPTIVTEIDNISINIYPNPASDILCLQSTVFGYQFSVIEIYDLNSRKLLKKQIPAGSEIVEVDVSSLQSGIYFCRLISEKFSITKKLIIQK
jgi:hypothetical protein